MTGLESQAMSLLAWLISTFGARFVMSTFHILDGSSEGAIVKDVSAFVASILTVIRTQVHDEKIRAMLDAEYQAADAVVDAAEKAKFG